MVTVKNVRKNQPEMNIVAEMKNTLQGINSRLDESEDLISNLKYKVAKNTQLEQEKEKRIKNNEDNLRGLRDNINHNNICIIGVPDEKREKN